MSAAAYPLFVVYRKGEIAMMTAKKGPSQMTKEEYREYNRLVQQRYRKRQKDTIAKLRAENERLRAELKEIKGGVSA